MSKKIKKLGRGLSSLFGDDDIEAVKKSEAVLQVALDSVEANPDQPRKHFDKDKLEELIASIKARGILSPILVREISKGKYQIIAGERRYRAAKRLKLSMMPVLVKDSSEQEVMELALIENIQRDDLNPIDEALACKMLADSYKYTQSKLAESLGKSRPYIANLLRILSLPDEIKEMLEKRQLTLGHAKIMVGKDNAVEVAHKIIREGLSVRQAEGLLLRKPPSKKHKTSGLLSSEDLHSLENIMSDKLDFKVQIKAKKNHSGEVVIRFVDFQELDQILQFLNNKK